ncbi:300_t:CDS:1, partial [Entrophospora sp. SA101]
MEEASNFCPNFDESREADHINYLLNKQKEIFKMIYYCEEHYTCRQMMLSSYYSWPNDQPLPQCKICDNYIRHTKEKPILCDISIDVVRMIKVVDAVIKHLKRKEKEATRDNIINVFCQAKNKNVNEKGFSELEIYKLMYNRVIKQQQDALHLLD